MKGIESGKALKTLLSTICNDKIYPLVAEQGTTYPFCIYRRVGIEPPSTKDKYVYDVVASYEITVVSDDYKSGLDIINDIADALINVSGEYNNIKINKIVIEDANEEYNDNGYIQNLTIKIYIY